MRCLDLFAGSKSVAKALPEYTVVSVDCNPKFDPDICVDILSWDYKAAFPVNHFDVIWASPPCTMYSKMRTRGGPRDLEGADALVAKTLEIIRHFQPRLWFLENPATGLLKTREVIAGIPFIDVSYCRYGFENRKDTRIWGTVLGFAPKLCRKGDRCESFLHEHGRHSAAIQNSYKAMKDKKAYELHQRGLIRMITGAAARGAVPAVLIRELVHGS